ncbi:hypothetical protein [Kibdelosporangium philippinense]|uniref:hypothetical protein n=1 Tax=Kibdelosporangium philippinense TaxID=211113 RepID=UPI00361E9A77
MIDRARMAKVRTDDTACRSRGRGGEISDSSARTQSPPATAWRLGFNASRTRQHLPSRHFCFDETAGGQ